VPATVWWIIDDSKPAEVLGSIHLRHEVDEILLADGGHIGYAVRPSARGQGVATATLELGLEEARRRGIIRVLLVCETDNPLSRRTILTAGGVLENTHETFERYWIHTVASPPAPGRSAARQAEETGNAESGRCQAAWSR